MRVPPLTGFIAGFIAAAVLWLALFAAAFGEPTSTSRWIHDVIAYKEQLARQVEGPKLIIAGGSGVLYSVRARDLGRELAIPAVNGGLHAGLGLEYILHETERLARPGDTVVLALEYDLYMRRYDDDVMLDYVIARDPAYFHRLSLRRQLRAFLVYPAERLANTRLVRLFGEPPSWPVYLDAYGDVLGNNSIFKTEAMRRGVASEPLRIRRPTADAVVRLRDFSAWAREHGVRAIATHPHTIRFEEYFEHPEVARDLDMITRMHADAGIPFIDQWADTMADARWFFDSPYHPDNIGATMRTRELAARLRPLLAGSASGPAYAPPAATHALEMVDRNFWRFEPLSGFGTAENVWAAGAPPFVPATAVRCEAVMRTAGASGAHLTARLRSSQRQAVQVLIGGERVASWVLEPSSAFQSFEADVRLAAGDNRLTLLKGSDTPVDIAGWRVDLPGDAAPGATAAR